jgi:hypothetical protein
MLPEPKLQPDKRPLIKKARAIPDAKRMNLIGPRKWSFSSLG